MMLALFLLLSQGQVQRLYNEGVLLGPIVKLDCVGPAVVCDISGTYFGRITISVTASTIGATGTPDSTTFLRGDNTWATPSGGGSANVVEVTVAFNGGNTTASTVVTGQAWVTTSSKIICAPALLAATGRAEGNEDAVIEGLTGAAHTRVLATGFTLTASKPGPGLYYGSQIFHCTGS